MQFHGTDTLKVRSVTWQFALSTHKPVLMKSSSFTNDLFFVISPLQLSKRNEFLSGYQTCISRACFMFVKTAPVCGDINGTPGLRKTRRTSLISGRWRSQCWPY